LLTGSLHGKYGWRMGMVVVPLFSVFLYRRGGTHLSVFESVS
jgi:hypothetical protein